MRTGPVEPVKWLVFWLLPIVVHGLAQTAAARDFSADRIVTSGSTVVAAHVNVKEDRWRFEYTHSQQGASVMIVRADKQHSWLILSTRRQFLEVPIATDHLLVVSEKMNGEVSREFIGNEILNGYSTELFEVTVSKDDELLRYYRWITKTERFPLKTVSKQGRWSEEFRRPIFTEQSQFLFELPLGLDNADPASMQR